MYDLNEMCISFSVTFIQNLFSSNKHITSYSTGTCRKACMHPC